MPKLPIGIQSFEKLRREGYLYIDKTMYIGSLLEGGSVYFLSRPRRFGKSLLVSTMEAYFQGKKDLFAGLAISDYEAMKSEEQQWISYPVMKFSLAGGEYQSPEGLEDMLDSCLKRYESVYLKEGETAPGKTLAVRFGNLIRMAAEECGRPVVILVDEYDKPLLENLSVNPEQEEKNRALFKSFFSVLKDKDEYLKFTFFTGVTKFSKVSIFSDLNQLRDISLLNQYSGICGMTQQEMERAFAGELTSLAAESGESVEECRIQLKEMYDGYCFSKDGVKVYNPFSLLNAFADLDLRSYWFGTGTPTFLIHKLQASRFRPVDFNAGVKSTEKAMDDYRIDNPDPVPLFYQSGYLTITGYDRRMKQYLLAFPNREVRNGFVDSIFPYYFNQTESEGAFDLEKFVYDLDHGDVDSFMTRLQSLFASLNYPEGAAPYSEHDFQSSLFIIFCMLGEVVRTEVHTAKGRTDCEAEDGGLVYLFEFKVDQTADEALRQINDMQYALKYAASGKTVYKIGVNFSTKDRTVTEWKVG